VGKKEEGQGHPSPLPTQAPTKGEHGLSTSQVIAIILTGALVGGLGLGVAAHSGILNNGMAMCDVPSSS